jgi:signal peptidase I
VLIPKPATGRGAVFEIVVIVAAAIGLALAIQAFAVKPYQIPSASMEPTLDIGQRVLVNRFSHLLGSDPEIGDVVVFHPPVTADGSHGPECSVEREPEQACPMNDPRESDTNFIKRVVAGPGDRLEVVDGIPVVNGERVEGDWTIRPCGGVAACNFPQAITIPPDHYFMMGDNRGSSDDSRFWGPVPRDWIIGQAFLTYWPPDRIGFL